MPQNPGNNAVTFIYPGQVVDRLHNIPTSSPINFVQTGCYVQPVNVKDKITDVAYTEATDKCIALYNANTGQVMAEWFMNFNNLNYRVLGAKLFYDRWARPVTITFYVREETPASATVLPE
jgi:hypothetical protein